ncbi:hypothetical protein [Halioxenophilus sp. WMMB6]|uniref:hypothetical protein n=1 Tax=Halioxenophilus sp. WMMB6 TaxID=3073815 RepID=UPI00295EEB90|nr:hypothetical protein [Halioxenophilus sp. WMMB6]
MLNLIEPVITREKESIELDIEQLYAGGLEIIRNLSSQVWTDYNVHDPGITLLEVLCYALTDLSYRAALPVADLLATEEDNASTMAEKFFTARQILPNRPVTELDYRKLLIDLQGVKNAWLKPASITYYADLPHARLFDTNPLTAEPPLTDTHASGIKPVELCGVYDVLIDFMEDVTTALERDEIIDSVRETLQDNRNLCEDFASIGMVDSAEFVVCGEIELTTDADPVAVNAQLLFELQDYMAPAPRNYSLTEMLTRRKADGGHYPVDEIFNGPALNSGFIPDDELSKAELKTQLRLSDVINIIMDIPGVRAIKKLVINRSGQAVPVTDVWLINVPPGKKALLNIAGSRLIFYKQSIPILPESNQVAEQYQQRVAAARQLLEAQNQEDLAIPLGRYRSPHAYHSLRHDLPAVYGVGPAGLPPGGDATRLAKAQQLKGYLLFFEQLLANYLAQLAHVGDLFATEPTLQRTYFYQAVNGFADWQALYNLPEGTTLVDAMEATVEDKPALVERRQRFLNHLIARFAESFTEYASVMATAFHISDSQLIQHKCQVLNNYPAISSNRGQAYNYSLQDDDALWNSDNVSGLEQRLAHLLDIKNYRRRNLSEIAYDIYAELDATPTDEFRFRIRHRETAQILLSSSTRYETEEDALTEMYQAIALASARENYQRKVASNGTHYFNIIDATSEVVARRIEYFETLEAMELAIDELITYLQTHYNDEGMYVIENLLLRPEQEGEPMLPICVDVNCEQCSDLDPYSYRLHIILPAYGARFSNSHFRQFAESVIRAEVPAHILPKVCWISREDMAALEGLYRSWVSLKSGRTNANRTTILTNFIDQLYRVKNVYPPEQLGDCSSDSKFILGSASLGSFSPATDDDQ